MGENSFWPWITFFLVRRLSCWYHLNRCVWIRVSHTNSIHSINSHSLTRVSKIWKLIPERVVHARGSVYSALLGRAPNGIFDPDDFLWAVTVPESTPYYHIPINLNPASPHLIHSSCYVGLYCWFIYNFRWSPTGLNILNIPGPPSHIPSSLNKHSTFSFLFTSWLKGSACSSPQTWCWINAFSCSLKLFSSSCLISSCLGRCQLLYVAFSCFQV